MQNHVMWSSVVPHSGHTARQHPKLLCPLRHRYCALHHIYKFFESKWDLLRMQRPPQVLRLSFLHC